MFGDLPAAYTARYPEVVVEVELADRRVNLIEEGFDLVLRLGPLPNSGLVTRKLGSQLRIGIYASPAYLELHGTPVEPRELRSHRCMVMSGAATSIHWPFVHKNKKESVSITPHVSINSYRVLAELAAAGVGLARLPEIHARPYLSGDRLVEVLRPFASAPFAPLAVYPSGRPTPAVRAMIDLWVEHFGRRGPCKGEPAV